MFTKSHTVPWLVNDVFQIASKYIRIFTIFCGVTVVACFLHAAMLSLITIKKCFKCVLSEFVCSYVTLLALRYKEDLTYYSC